MTHTYNHAAVSRDAILTAIETLMKSDIPDELRHDLRRLYLKLTDKDESK